MSSESFLSNMKPCLRNGDPASTIFWHVKPLRKSLSECLATHQMCPRPSKTFMPTRLLRLHTNEDNEVTIKLVHAWTGDIPSYAALSYCWGGDQELKLTPATQLQLAAGVNVDTLPLTLRDACLVTLELEIFYLWIDSFCIFQTDIRDKNHEIKLMDQIYQNSTVTIAASRARVAKDGFLKPTLSLLPSPGYTEPLDTRGWAFQEDLLSPRVVQFPTFGEVAYFSCSNNIGNFNQPKARGLVQSITTGRDHRFTTDQWVRFSHDQWATVLSIFTSKTLSYPEDRLPALTGVANIFRRHLTNSSRNLEPPEEINWKYCDGIWVPDGKTSHCLQWSSIVWKVSSLSGALLPRPASYHGPSWSWGSINAPVTTFRFGGVRGDTSERAKMFTYTRILSIGAQSIDRESDDGAVKDGVLVMRGILVKARWTLEWSRTRDVEFLDENNWIAPGRTKNLAIDSHIPASRTQSDHPYPILRFFPWKSGSALSAFGLPDAAIAEAVGNGKSCAIDVFLLPVVKRERSNIEGLILKQTPRGTYRRLGAFGDLKLQEPPNYGASQIDKYPADYHLASWFREETVHIE